MKPTAEISFRDNQCQYVDIFPGFYCVCVTFIKPKEN